MSELISKQDLSDDAAREVLKSAVKRARELDCKMNVALVGLGGHLKAFFHMEGAWTGSIDISIRKAKTARYFNMDTGEIGKLSQPGESLYNIEHSNGGLITFPGGVPLKNVEGDVVGAIGVSGSTVENDHEVASTGAQALFDWL